MKTILLIIALTLSASAATLYPVMSDNTNRTITGGATNVALLSGTNVFSGTNTFNTNTILGTAKLQDTLDSKPTVALTNIAQLNQSQTWTGTPTFPATVFSANNMGMRLLSSASAPVYIESMPVVSNPTNNGDYALVTPVSQLTIPPLLGSNSGIALTLASYRTNANTSSGNIVFYIGPNTNFVAMFNTLNTTAANQEVFGLNRIVIQSAGSWTNQITPWVSTWVIGPTNFFDSTITNTLYIGAYVPSGSTRTNDIIFGVAAYEVYRP